MIRSHAPGPSSLLLLALTAACGTAGHPVASGLPPPAEAIAYGGAAEPIASAESYTPRVDNPEIPAAAAPMSTFSIDVDTASYANVRRFLDQGQLPPRDAVRIEELVNYFDYAYPDPDAGRPLTVVTEVGPSPFHRERRLVHVGIQGRRIAAAALPARNLVFLIDTSGSMAADNKLPLLRRALSLLAETLTARDRVGIVVYAGSAGVVLEPTADRAAVIAALDRLGAGGSTNGGAGIDAAYALAREHFDPAAVNRVILCTDGDFNVGVSDPAALVKKVEAQRDSGVYLTVLGLGMGNLKDSTMEQLAQHGNGNYAYLDSLAEARKVLIDEGGGTLVTIARDVKVQVQFDPTRVRSYRLLGYENRLLADRDFADDRKDAGELGAGDTVTALYEIVPAAPGGGELATVRVRYRRPAEAASTELATPVRDGGAALGETSDAFRFAAAAAGLGLLLRGGEPAGDATWAQIRGLAAGATADDSRRSDLVRLLDAAAALSGTQAGPAIAR